MMMTCFEGVGASRVLWAVVGVSAMAAFVMLWMLRFQRFQGKAYYGMTFVAMIWTLLMVGLEGASTGFSCKLQWATLAWLGNALVPVAWCFFVFAYVQNASWLSKRWVEIALVAVPSASFAFAATNQWHGLVYTDASVLAQGGHYIDYVHGLGFYAIICTLYAFVFATLWCLARAFMRAERVAWPLLSMLVIITITPLAANAAYVGLHFTVFGLDPTAFMFTFGIVAFTWMLVSNKTMDMTSVGQSILFDTISEPVVLIDNAHNIVQMNTAAKDSGLHNGAGRLLNDVIENFERLNASKEIAYMRIGQRVYEPRIQEVGCPLDPAGSPLGWSVTFVDITNRIATSVALEKALAKADEAIRAKDDFISVVSHELRTPLTSLTGGLTLALSGKLGDVPDPVYALLNIAQRNGVRLSRLVDNILLAQKIDIDALKLDAKPVKLDQLLRESFEENRMFASERGVKLDLCKDTHPATVTGDAFAIRQIIDNLVSNAIKFSHEHGVVEGALETLDGRVRLSVKNAGPGIPDGMEGQVFGRFEQVKNSGQSATQGSGLGLHISKKLAMQMSGDIFYESQVGAHTTFHVEFQMTDQPLSKVAELAG